MFTKELFTSDHFAGELVDAVGNRLDSGQFTDAILVGVRVLSEKLRYVSSNEGDGAKLVGQVLGGTAPQFRLNRLQTNSEKDEQKGIEQLLRGIYMGIRNPRTHEVTEDTEDFAIRVLCLVDLGLGYLSRESYEFDVDALVNRLYEPHFVPNPEYAQALVADTPEDMLVAVFRRAFERRDEGKSDSTKYFFFALYQMMSQEQMSEATQIAGEALRTESEGSQIAKIFRILKPETWPMLQDDVQIRLENIVIDECRKGKHDVHRTITQHGLGSWGNRFGRYFNRRAELAEVLVEKLTPSWYTQNYVGRYYMSVLPVLVTEDSIPAAANGLAYAAIGNNALVVRNELKRVAPNYPHEWREQLRVAVQEYRDSEPEYVKELLESIGDT